MNEWIENINFFGYHFFEGYWLLLLLLLPILLYFRYQNLSKNIATAKFSRSPQLLQYLSFGLAKNLIRSLYLCYTFAGVGLILALAKPYKVDQNAVPDYEEGINIMMVMDISGSMMATDFLPNRLEAAKNIAKEFVGDRSSDKIGIVVFEGEAYTACPLTKNHEYLETKIDEIETGRLVPGTAIGTGLGTAVARLRNDTIGSKVIILLTDGESNRGQISPLEAADLAKKKGIKVYTIGMGKNGVVKMPIQTPFGKIMQETVVKIDEKLLTEMAQLTGGKYFRATNNASLREIYSKIDQLEKVKFADKKISKEPPYSPNSFLWMGIVLLCAGMIIEQVILKKDV